MEKLRLPIGILLISFAGDLLDVFNALIAFILTGAIPGTPSSIPSGAMLFVSIIFLWLVALWFVLPKLVARHTLQIQRTDTTPETTPADAVVRASSEPGFRLFSPVVRISR